MATPYRQLLAEARQLLRRGQWNAAEKLYQEVLALRPRDIETLTAIGLLRTQATRYEEAADLFRQVLALQPYAVDALGNLGAVLAAAGRHEEAIVAFQKLLALKPDHAGTHYNLGISLKGLKRWEEASAAYRRAIALKPEYAEAWFNLGNALRASGKTAESIAAYEAALRISPAYAEACSNLGHALRDMREWDKAIEAFRRSLAMKPDFHEGSAALAGALRDIGEVDQSLQIMRSVAAKNPTDLLLRGSLLYTLECTANQDAEAIFAEYRKWGEGHAVNRGEPHTNDRSPTRRLRVGYVSADFRRHSVSYFLQGFLCRHNPDLIESFGYSDVAQPDEITTQFSSDFSHWTTTADLSAAQFVERVRQDAIDILVDLSGHTNTPRLVAFAQKPAPLQITYLGYPGTTGLKEMDYRLTDPFADPPGMTDNFHTETLFRLPRTFLCYTPPPTAPAVRSLPAESNGFLTFGCFSKLTKITTDMLSLWAAILGAVPRSHLFIKGGGVASATATARIREFFAARSISPERLRLSDMTPSVSDHLELYNQVDIAFDTFPYHGTTTTCEALWMGVPVVSLVGTRHVSRVGASILHQVGLDALLAPTHASYAQIAVDLANDRSRLAALRDSLRDRMIASPLMDYTSFTKDIEAAYRDLWVRWCTTQSD